VPEPIQNLDVVGAEPLRDYAAERTELQFINENNIETLSVAADIHDGCEQPDVPGSAI